MSPILKRHYSLIGTKGGKSRSPAKIAASRKNATKAAAARRKVKR